MVPFSLLTGPTRKACRNLKLHNMVLSEILTKVRKKVLFDGEAMEPHVTFWKKATFDQFRKHSGSEESSTYQCHEFMVEYRKNLPPHLLGKERLYGLIRSIFYSIILFETLYQRL